MTFAKSMGGIAVATAALSVAQLSFAESLANGYRVDGDPWAIGYAVETVRSCSNWTLEPQELLAQRGVLPKPGSETGLTAFDGPFQRDYYRGQADAETDRARRTDFCRNLPGIAGSRWNRLAHVLISGAK